MKEALRSDLKELTSLIGVSGDEGDVIKYLKPRLKKIADEVVLKSNGNLIAIKRGTKPGPKLMFSAHMDEIGFTVKSILDNGFILYEKSGAFSDRIVPGRKILLKARNGIIPGIIGIRAGHLDIGKNGVAQASSKSYIDVGASSKEEVINMGIQVGTRGVLQSDFMEMNNKDLISTRAIDNRMNCAILLELLKNIQSSDISGDVYCVFSVQEETSISGIVGAVNFIKPDYAIVLDTVPCGDVPDIDTNAELPVLLGRGPVCVVALGLTLGLKYSYIHPKLRKLVETQAEKLDINIQYLSMTEDGYNTEASTIVNLCEGIPTASISVPRRYSHSPVELVNLNDAVDLCKLVQGIVENNDKINLNFI